MRDNEPVEEGNEMPVQDLPEVLVREIGVVVVPPKLVTLADKNTP